MLSSSALWGVIRYEFRMQWRRPSQWVGFAFLAPLLFFGGLGSIFKPALELQYSHTDLALTWVTFVNIFTLGAGLMLADRMSRDRTTKVSEILQTLPTSTLTRVTGKWMGATSATLLPILGADIIGIGICVYRWHDMSFVPVTTAAIPLMIALPVFFVGAYAVACTTVLWTPLFQFLFVGYFFWTTLNPIERIPTLNATFLTPTCRFVLTGILHYRGLSNDGYYPLNASIWQGLANIAALVVAAIVAIVAASSYLDWQAKHQ